MKVLIAVTWANRMVDDLRKALPDIEFLVGETQEEIDALASEADVAIGSISRESFLAAKNLKWIQSSSAGVEWMGRIPEIQVSDVKVTNVRGAHATTIAEHTLGMLFFLTRGFGMLYENQKAHKWGAGPDYGGRGVAGLTMGVIGLGQLGRAIAKRAEACEMTVIAVDVHEVPKPDYVSEVGLLDKMDDLLQRSDVVVVAAPITDQTKGMLGPDQLVQMKSSAYLVVISRGKIIDEPTLIQMLNDGKLAGAALDVTYTEPLPEDDPLWDAPNCFITPHCSPSSDQTHSNVKAIIIDNLKRYMAGEELVNPVNKKLGY
ncbi:MAG: D-2-hydroxyacid dehydrogenase [Chloroflexota bacterium]